MTTGQARWAHLLALQARPLALQAIAAPRQATFNLAACFLSRQARELSSGAPGHGKDLAVSHGLARVPA